MRSLPMSVRLPNSAEGRIDHVDKLTGKLVDHSTTTYPYGYPTQAVTRHESEGMEYQRKKFSPRRSWLPLLILVMLLGTAIGLLLWYFLG
jgi:hypothetical protein